MSKANRPRKRVRPLSKVDALARLQLTFEALKNEVAMALRTKAVLEAGNTLIRDRYSGVQFDGADCYNALKMNAEVALVLSLSKLYELPRPRGGATSASALNRSDIASIPTLLWLLRQKRCRAHFIAFAATGWGHGAMGMAATWKDNCIEALTKIDNIAPLLRSRAGREAHQTLSRYRDDQIAHLYYRSRERLPNRYEEIFLLLDVARDLVEQTSLALHGINIDLEEREQIWLDSAKSFWEPALEAAIRTGS